MLIRLDGSMLAIVESTECNTTAMAAISNVSSAIRSGNHALTADRETLKACSSCIYLSEVDRALFNHVYQKWTQLASLESLVDVELVIGVFEHEVTQVSVNNRLVIRVDVGRFVNFDLLNPTILLLENQNDEVIYDLISSSISSLNPSQGVLVRWDAETGGGQTTAARYGTLQDRENRLVLCLPDSDRKYPMDSLGQTAQSLIDTDNADNPLANLWVIPVHESENLIPYQIFSTFFQGLGVNNRCAEIFLRNALDLIEKGHEDSLLYFDIKKGISCKEINALAVNQYSNYWLPIVAVSCSDADCNHVECSEAQCGRKVMHQWPYCSELLSYIGGLNRFPISRDSGLYDIWSQVYNTILRWCIADEPLSC